MADNKKLKILFVINPGSGNNSTDWATQIEHYFTSTHHTIELFQLPANCHIETIKNRIELFTPNRVIAVGGDGTVKLVAECLMEKNIALGILPAGSANGLAKELGIDMNPTKALDVIVGESSKKIHMTSVNNQMCVHLSDIGLNANMLKEFETQQVRGMWGYLKAFLKVLWQNPKMKVEMRIDNKTIRIKAEMVVIANATKYGSGAIINPIGKLDDEFFEVIAIKQLSPLEILKMTFSIGSHDAQKTEIFQTNDFVMRSKRNVHFQVDGEYLGKVKEVKANIMPNVLEILVPVLTTSTTV